RTDYCHLTQVQGSSFWFFFFFANGVSVVEVEIVKFLAAIVFSREILSFYMGNISKQFSSNKFLIYRCFEKKRGNFKEILNKEQDVILCVTKMFYFNIFSFIKSYNFHFRDTVV